MITTPVVGNAGSSRRTLYRHTKRMLLRLLARRWKGPRTALEPAVRRFLRARSRSYLHRLVGDRGFALAAAASLLAAGAAGALPPLDLSAAPTAASSSTASIRATSPAMASRAPVT